MERAGRGDQSRSSRPIFMQFEPPKAVWTIGFQELEIVSRFGAISSLNLPDFPEKKPFLRPFPDIPWKFARKMRENNQKHYGSNATE